MLAHDQRSSLWATGVVKRSETGGRQAPMPDRKPSASPPTSPGLAARRVAVDIVSGVLRQKRPLDDLLERSEIGALPERDRALVRTIVATVLRRLGTLRHMFAVRLERGL